MDIFEQKISAHIAENILFRADGYPYPLGSSFKENGILDSMNVLELVLFVEENFTVQVPEDDTTLEHFDSVEKIGSYLRGKLQEQAADSL